MGGGERCGVRGREGAGWEKEGPSGWPPPPLPLSRRVDAPSLGREGEGDRMRGGLKIKKSGSTDICA
jgi:hypothetical protein